MVEHREYYKRMEENTRQIAQAVRKTFGDQVWVNQAPSQFEAMFLSTAHTREDIEYTIELITSYQNRN